MTNSEQTPESVRRPVIVTAMERPQDQSYEVMFRDRGVWRIDVRDFVALPMPLRDLAECFAARPDLFTFIERKAIAHGTNI